MRIAWFIAATAAASVGSPATAEEPTPQPKKEKLICKYEPQTGSRTRSTRICLTEAQWREVGIATKKGVDDFNRHNAMRQGTGGSTGLGN